jgi:hypothetical protein
LAAEGELRVLPHIAVIDMYDEEVLGSLVGKGRGREGAGFFLWDE